MSYKIELDVEETIKKKIPTSKTKTSLTVYVPYEWAGKDVMVCLLPEKEMEEK